MINVFGSRRKRISRRLAAISSELTTARQEMAVLEEQVHHIRLVEAETTTDAVVAGTPAAAREKNAAHSDRRRTEKARDRVRQRIAQLTSEQDSLLEQLLE